LPARPHDDQVGVHVDRDLLDLLGRIADADVEDDLLIELHPGLVAVLDGVFHQSVALEGELLFEQVHLLPGIDGFVLRQDVHRMQLVLGQVRDEPHRFIECAAALGGEVHGDDDFQGHAKRLSGPDGHRFGDASAGWPPTVELDVCPGVAGAKPSASIPLSAARDWRPPH
jgi:hypothetical protein